MRDSSRPGWSWRFAAALIGLAALAQGLRRQQLDQRAPGGRLELRFSQVKGTRLGALPQGCTGVKITFQPGNLVFTLNDTQGSLLLPTGQYAATAVATCNGIDFPSDKPDPIVNVPAGLGEVQVSFVFGGVNVTLTVQAGSGVSVSGDGIACPGDCTQTFFAGSSVKLTANNPAAVFSGGCNGTGSCTVLMNQDKTVVVGLSAQNGIISVTNVDDCQGDCGTILDILIDGVLVADNLGVFAPPVTKQVSAGQHNVRAFCFGSQTSQELQAQNPNVPPGGTANVAFDSGNCDD